MASHKKLYPTVEEIQVDLGTYMDYCNRVRRSQGRYCQGAHTHVDVSGRADPLPEVGI